MIKKTVVAFALALVIVGFAAPGASAGCIPPKTAKTYNSVSGAFIYWHTSLPTGTGSGTALVGQLWSGTADYTGTCSVLYFGLSQGDIGLSSNLGDACATANCPSGSLSVKATAIAAGGASQQFLAVSRPETPTTGVDFDFSTSFHNMVADPTARPRVLSSSRTGTNINLNVATDPYSSTNGWFDGTGNDITGWNILSATGVADPGRLASSYAFRAFIPAANGAAGPATIVAVDCSDITKDQWVVAALVTVAGQSRTTGPPSRVKCNPALAEPKYKLVPNPKKVSGIGPIRN